MIFALHGKNDKFIWNKFQDYIDTWVSANDIEVMKSRETLEERLAQPFSGNTVVILITTDRQDLIYLFSIIHLLRKVRLILVIPDQEPETVREGYKLEPRFLSSGIENFSEVRAVLVNMLREGKCTGSH